MKAVPLVPLQVQSCGENKLWIFPNERSAQSAGTQRLVIYQQAPVIKQHAH